MTIARRFALHANGINKKLSTKNGHFLEKKKTKTPKKTPFLWIPQCSTIFWESKTEKK